MWQRFTERARRVVFFAQEEAGRLGQNHVSTEHLLLGLIRENDSVAARILDRVGVSLGRLRSEVERQVARGDGQLGQDMQLTPRAKRVIDLAYDEARQLNNNYIGTEHLLLGLIREGDGLAGQVLRKLGVEHDAVYQEVMKLQDEATGAASDTQTPSRDPAPVDATARARAQPRIGDLGVLENNFDGKYVEVAWDLEALLHLVVSYRARDHYGYRELVSNGRIVRVPTGTEVKRLQAPSGYQAGKLPDEYYVRLLSGDYAGKAGWIVRNDFHWTGPDEAPFPPTNDPAA